MKNYSNGTKCSRCGQCCTDFLPISKKEEKLIKAYIKDKGVKPVNWKRPNGTYLFCPFFDDEKHCCRIYEVRPQICRSFRCYKDESTLTKERDLRIGKAYYNTIKKIGKHEISYRVASLYDIFYDNPEITLRYVYESYKHNTGAKDLTSDNVEDFKNYLVFLGRKDIADSITPVYEEKK